MCAKEKSSGPRPTPPLFPFFLALPLLFLSWFGAGCQEKARDNRATLKIITIPKGASLHFNYKEIGESPASLKVRPGVYVLKATKVGYEDAWEKIVCTPNSIKTVELNLNPVVASVLFTSSPAGAKVVINETGVGETPLVLRNFPVGDHSATFSRLNCAPLKVNWKIEDNRPQLVQAELKSNVGTLQIDSSPAGANIFINGEPQGRTPFKVSLEEGIHRVRVELTGHASQEQVATVKRGETVNVLANLAILPGDIEITSSPTGAQLYIADKHYGNTPMIVKDLAPGVYLIRVEKDGYDNSERKVNILAGQKTKLEIRLPTNMGGIDLAVNPPGITIYLDGKLQGVSEPGEDPKISKVFSMRNLAAGKHVLLVAHKRAQPSKREIKVSVKKGEITRLLNEEMWISDHKLKLRNGNTYIGRLRGVITDKEEIEFEPQPGIAVNFKKSEVEALTPLQDEE